MLDYIKFFSTLSRKAKVAVQLVMDGTLLILSFVGAMIFRLESVSFMSDVNVWKALALATVSGLLAFRLFGLYRVLVRYITGKILLSVGQVAIRSARIGHSGTGHAHFPSPVSH